MLYSIYNIIPVTLTCYTVFDILIMPPGDGSPHVGILLLLCSYVCMYVCMYVRGRLMFW